MCCSQTAALVTSTAVGPDLMTAMGEPLYEHAESPGVIAGLSFFQERLWKQKSKCLRGAQGYNNSVGWSC